MKTSDIYKQALNDAMYVLSKLHGYTKKGHLYDKGIRDALIELRDAAPNYFGDEVEVCSEPKTLKDFKEQFEKLFLEMKKQVGVVSLEIKECEEYNCNGWSPQKEKVIKFDIKIENS